MPENSNTQSADQRSYPNPTVQRLAKLVGTWDTEVRFPQDEAAMKGARVTFEWLEEGHFLVQRSHGQSGDFPQSFTVMGCDDGVGSFTMLYYDSRGVSRIYQMSLTATEWKLWREAPGFSQRFTGTFSDDGKTIHAAWEKSEDGTQWEVDFHLTYTKTS